MVDSFGMSGTGARMQPDQENTPPYQRLLTEGEALQDMLSVEPKDRGKEVLSFDGALNVLSVTMHQAKYIITADLPQKLACCTHCNSPDLKKYGRWVARLGDIPYIDPRGFPSSVEYEITAQRYQCNECKRGVFEPIPANVAAAVTTSRITYRLSTWLIAVLRTETTYEKVHRMIGYSSVWVRKWYTEVKEIYGLGNKLSKPGRKPKRTL